MSEKVRLKFVLDNQKITRDVVVHYFNTYLRRHTEILEESTDIVTDSLATEFIISTYPIYASLIISVLSELDGVKHVNS